MPHHTHKDRSYFPRDKKRDRAVNSKGGRHNNRHKRSLREEARKVRHTAAEQISTGLNDYLDILQSFYGDYDFYDYDQDLYHRYDSRYDYIDETYDDYVSSFVVFNTVMSTKFYEAMGKCIAT